MRSRERRRAWVCGLVLAVAAAAGCGTYQPVARPANFDLVLKDMNGADVDLATFKGQPLIVNLWATWCAPCQAEMPQLVALADKYRRDGLVVIGISADDTPAEIQAFAKAFDVTYPLLVARDRPEALTAFEYTGLLPTTAFVNRQGIVVGRLVGRGSDDFFERQIRDLLIVP